MKTKYEIHVNGHEIGEDLEPILLSLGFFPDPFEQGVPGTRNVPPHHFTFESFNDPANRDYVWEKALEAVKEDPNFKGYIESETVPEIFCIKLEEKPFMPSSVSFPLPVCKTIEVPIGKCKAADIHVKRSGNLPRDALDEMMLAHNFYEVHTPRNRIFTFQTEAFSDAKASYEALRDYFSKVGGVKQVDLEVTGKFYRKPMDFPVARVVPKGYMK